MEANRQDGRSVEPLVQRVLMALLLVTCVTSDYFLYQQDFLPNTKLIRHLVDNAAHGLVSFCCWGIFLCQIDSHCLSNPTQLPIPVASLTRHINHSWVIFLKQCLIAGILASLLDVDHFIAAWSLSIAGATHLKGRPFGHSVTFIMISVLIVAKFPKNCTPAKRRKRICLVVTAFLSHQLRDGMRRGLWFWPFGSTPPIPYVLYLLMEETLPFILAKWQRRVMNSTSRPAEAVEEQLLANMEYQDNDEREEMMAVDKPLIV